MAVTLMASPCSDSLRAVGGDICDWPPEHPHPRMPGGAFDESGTGMQHPDRGRVDLLEQALIEYIERYGMSDAAARAMRVGAQPHPRKSLAVGPAHPKTGKINSTKRAVAPE